MSASKKFNGGCCKRATSIGSGGGGAGGGGSGGGDSLWELQGGQPQRVSTKLNRSVHVDNTISSLVLEIVSDRRLKTDIEPITADTTSTNTLFNSIEAKKFTYKKRPNDIHYGFIAQDIKKAGNGLEHLVSTNDKGFHTVRMLEIVPFLFAKIKQLEGRIAQLEK